MDQTSRQPTIDRRDILYLLGGVAGANALGVGAWLALEALVGKGRADTYHKSVCRYCGTGCGVQVGLRDGKVSDVRGDELAHNAGVICVKGATLPRLLDIPGRLTTPRVRKGGKLVEASWDEAMALVATKFREAIAADGPDAVAFYGSGQLLIEESYTANKLFKAGIRTNNVDGNPRLCMASAAAGYTQVYGKDEPPGCYEDIDHADCFFLIGANMYDCHPPLFERIQRRRRSHPETTLICVDPRRTRTAELSDIHLAPVPGTDLLLLNAMAWVICAEGLLDNAFIGRHVKFSDGKDAVDLAAFRKFLEAYTPEAVQTTVGISADRIRDVAFRFARSKATMSLWTMGINQRTQGTFLNNMLNGLHLLTGQICRPGATPFSLTGQSNACGGVRDTGTLSHALPNGRVVSNPEHRAEVEQLWGVPKGTIAAKPGHDAVSLFRAMESGKVKAALVMCTNPAQSMPAADRYRAAMKKCFLAVAEVVEDSETAKQADVLLPAALWIEKEGVYGQGERRYQLLEKLLDPPGQCRSDLAILVDLADRLGHRALLKARTPEEVWEEYRVFSAKSYYNFEGMTRERLRKRTRIALALPNRRPPGDTASLCRRIGPFCCSRKRHSLLREQRRPCGGLFAPYVPSPEKTSPEYPLLLTTGRVLEQWHTGTMTGRIDELARASGAATVELNEQDAFALGIRGGDRVEVASRYGTMQATAKVSPSPRRGVAFASFWDVRLLINKVVSDHVDPTSKEPEFKVTAVRIRKVGGGEGGL